MNTYHILNGDALKQQFPKDEIEGEFIVARECMVDGPVQSNSLEELFELRSKFISDGYGYGNGKYEEVTIPEFNKIRSIAHGEVNLWFEEDLFCQVNFWFVCSLLYQKNIQTFLVLPKTPLEYGFGGLDGQGLRNALENRQAMTPINVNQFAILWFAYKNNHLERLLKIGVQLHSDFPFVMKAIEAHFDRLPEEGRLTKPEQIILDIIKEKSTQDFGTVFREFNKRAAIYGYGALQAKHIFDRVLRENF
ncbi:MAG: DUF1835 domain-containing protein [Ekhidna sp.]|uniref:DUF1835 domain-containing protein n=1 Tax=Ekhidna sp. TaxID=2608089 RepID=UPI0032EBD48D